MTWTVEATHAAGTFSIEFGDLREALVFQIGMLACGYDTTEPLPVDGARHLTVINGGRGSGVSNAAPAARRNAT